MQGVPYLEKRAGFRGGCNDQRCSGGSAQWKADAVVKGTQRRGRLSLRGMGEGMAVLVWRAEQGLRGACLGGSHGVRGCPLPTV